MRDGYYHLHYETTTLNASAVVVLDSGVISGCDLYYFITGGYVCENGRLAGKVIFRRHTPRQGKPAFIPETFELEFAGVGSETFGQFEVHCPGVPEITGRAAFSWFGDLNAQTHPPAA